jgi:hypothetical protein
MYDPNLDWFRFWLTNEEDPDPTKATQYIRWGELRKLKQENQNVPPSRLEARSSPFHRNTGRNSLSS